jgi:glucosamine--fructose-6-phosphate aminotransferase (isomerizing)
VIAEGPSLERAHALQKDARAVLDASMVIQRSHRPGSRGITHVRNYWYIGGTQAMPILIEGLKRLEYRGYDSAGVAIMENGSLLVEKTKGKISQLERLVNHRTWLGSTGMATPRWATHGDPIPENAHPTPIAPVTLPSSTTASLRTIPRSRTRWRAEGHTFTTQTDTEVIAHLVEKFYKQGASLEEAVQRTVGSSRAPTVSSSCASASRTRSSACATARR